MSNETPTDALRLVPVPYVVLSEAAGLLDCEGYGPIALTLNNLLAAAPAPPLPGGGWQDISTAPRDGTPLLAGSIHHSDREVVCWQDGLPSGSIAGAMNPDAPEEGWVNEGPHKDRFYANPRYFTHWQPLPAAPTGDA